MILLDSGLIIFGVKEKKQLKGLNKLEKRLLKAQKNKLADHVGRMVELQNQLFPNPPPAMQQSTQASQPSDQQEQLSPVSLRQHIEPLPFHEAPDNRHPSLLDIGDGSGDSKSDSIEGLLGADLITEDRLRGHDHELGGANDETTDI